MFKQELLQEIKRNKHLYVHLVKYFEIELEEIRTLLEINRVHDDKTYLQGQIKKVKEFLKLLA